MDALTLIGIIISIMVGVPTVLAIICKVSNPINISLKQFVSLSIRIIVILSVIVLLIVLLFYFFSQAKVIEKPSVTETTEIEKPSAAETTTPVIYTSLSYLNSVADSNKEGSTTDVSIGDWKDMFGNRYPGSIKFWVVNKSGWSNTEYITYQLNGQYETLSGSIVAGEGSDSGAQSIITIYLDGQLKYDSDIITNSTQPVSFSVDVSGTNELRIVCSTDVNRFGYCIVSAMLS